MTNSTVDAVLQNPRIPTLPMVAVQVLRLSREANVDLHRLSELIQNDQALSVKIIRTVNSSYYGLAKPCSSISQAVVYLGVKAVQTLMLGFSLVESIDGGGDFDIGFDYAEYWRRSFRAAATAREIATLTGACDPEQAFLAALIQDVGMIALHRTYGDVYLQIIDLTKGEHRRLVQIEYQSFQTNHAMIGGALAERWRFPEPLVRAIRSHHERSVQAEAPDTLARCTALAAELAGGAGTEEPASDESYRMAEERFELTKDAIDELLPRVVAAVPELARLYEIDAGAAYDSEQLMSKAEDERVEREIALVRELEQRETATSCEGGAQRIGAAPSGQAHEHQLDCDELLLALEQNFNDVTGTGESFALLLLTVDDFISPQRKPSAEEQPTITPDSDQEELVQRIRSRLAESSESESSSRLFRIDHATFALCMMKSDRRDAARKAETLRLSVASQSEPFGPRKSSPHADSKPITLSIGLATFEPELQTDIDSPSALLRIAMQALHAAMQAGGNCVRIYSPAPRERAVA